MESSERQRRPSPRASAGGMTVGVKAGETLRAAPGSLPLCRLPARPFFSWKGSGGELCAHRRGRWWPGSEEGACSPPSLYPLGPAECPGLSLPPRKPLVPSDASRVSLHPSWPQSRELRRPKVKAHITKASELKENSINCLLSQGGAGFREI